jgi:uncharacterized delta-60 repeat protein
MKLCNFTSKVLAALKSFSIVQIACACIMTITIQFAYSQTALDPTFGNSGKVITNLSTYEKASSVITQPDGKILIGYNNSSEKFGIIRYNSNGSIDNTFGTNGLATFDFSINDGNSVYKIVLQPDGKILAAGGVGYDSQTYPNEDFAIVRFNSNGLIDNTFGSNGKVIIDISNDDAAIDIVLQTDGKILIGGVTNKYTSNVLQKFALVRLNTNGGVDNTFGISGKVITGLNASYIIGTTLKIQSDGKILFAGLLDERRSSKLSGHVLVRYLSNGTLDTSFGIDGIVTSNNLNSNYFGIFTNMVLLSDGKIILGGLGLLTTGYKRLGASLVKLNNNGGLDNTFGTNGIMIDTNVLRVDTLWTEHETPIGMTLQSDGKIVLGFASQRQIKLARFNSNGNRDNLFGTQGEFKFDFGNLTTNERPYEQTEWFLHFSNDKKIIVAGSVRYANSSGDTNGSDVALARINVDISSSIISTLSDEQFVISPNPTKHNIFINLEDNKEYLDEVIIMDLNGQNILQRKVNENQISLNLDFLPSGLYFLKIKTKEGKEGIKKFVKD